jgi:predicted nucleotide-binding protein
LVIEAAVMMRAEHPRQATLPLERPRPRGVRRTRSAATRSRAPQGRPKVFVAHGRDEAAKEKVARFLELVGLDAVVLNEQSDGGQFILEKFERHADVAFALALLTSDDRCGRGFRARQNVILELGYFLHRLQRTRVRVLYTAGVELPSDILGWLYIEMDGAEAWKLKLARELLAAGVPLDLKRLLEAP